MTTLKMQSGVLLVGDGLKTTHRLDLVDLAKTWMGTNNSDFFSTFGFDWPFAFVVHPLEVLRVAGIDPHESNGPSPTPHPQPALACACGSSLSSCPNCGAPQKFCSRCGKSVPHACTARR